VFPLILTFSPSSEKRIGYSSRQGKIPFEIAADPFYSEANQARLMKSIAQLEAGKGTARELIEVDDE
jgi:hypothetical protein